MLKWLFLSSILILSNISNSQDLLVSARQASKNGDYDVAIKTINNLLDSESSDLRKCEAFLELARLQEIKGDLEGSLISIESADSINKNLASDTLQIRILLARGHHFLVFERNEKAEKVIEEAIGIAEETGIPKYKAYSFNQLSSVHHQLGDYQKALDYLEQAGSYLRDNPEDHDLIMIHKKRADNYYLLHEIEKSGIEYEKSYALASKYYAPTHDLILRLHNDLGAVYSDLEQYDKARLHLSNTISQESRLKANHSIGDAYYYLSLLESYEKNHDLSIHYAQKSLELFEKVYGTPSYWVCAGWVNLADMYYQSGDLQKAVENYHMAFLANDTTFNNEDPESNPEFQSAVSKVYYIVAMMEKARMLLELYKESSEMAYLNSAYNSYKYLLEAIRQQRIFYGASSIQLDFGEDISEVYGYALECSYTLYEQVKDQKYLAEALQIAEQGKAYYLALSVPSELDLQRWLEPENAELLNTYRENEIINKLSFEEQRDYDSRLNQLRKDYPEVYFQWFDLKKLDLDSLHKWLDEDEMIIEYVLTEDGVYMFAMDQFQSQFLYQPIRMDTLISYFRQSIQQRNEKDILESGNELYKILVENISISDQVKKLKIVPDKDLHYIPFEALITDRTKPEFLIHEYEISYEHSIRLSLLHQGNNSGSLQFFGFAPSFNSLDPISEASNEVNSIAILTRGTAWTDQNASVERLLSVINEAGVLHFSTHAEVNHDDPSASFMILRSDSSEYDQKINPSFISSLDLNAELVTLSSCNTGVGKFQDGEGVLSLARNFALAGSPSIVMSLWPAADQSSSALMIDFYSNLKKGMSKSEALRAAKLTHLEKSDNLSKMPYFWAHLVLIGDDSAVKFEPANGPNYLNWILIFLVPLIAFLAWKKLKGA